MGEIAINDINLFVKFSISPMHILGMKEDGLPIPDPRSIDAIQADNSLDGWRDGAVLIWVPVIIETHH